MNPERILEAERQQRQREISVISGRQIPEVPRRKNGKPRQQRVQKIKLTPFEQKLRETQREVDEVNSRYQHHEEEPKSIHHYGGAR
jgi:hypothetical protein